MCSIENKNLPLGGNACWNNISGEIKKFSQDIHQNIAQPSDVKPEKNLSFHHW